jgi:formylglycine-generating enzyme required for sulfatase activity
MVLVEGHYCPNVKQVCMKFADPPESPFAGLRCAEYKKPTECEGAREERRYCIDREEYAPPGDPLPRVHATWTQASATCSSRGARLCTEAEWQFACEGEQMLPYPYGFVRDNTACNFDRTNLGKMGEGLYDYRAKITDYPRCLSPFGVHDMVGNVDEWTRIERAEPPFRSALRGGWWLPGRNRCRAATIGHGESYTGPQVGFRCCRDAD